MLQNSKSFRLIRHTIYTFIIYSQICGKLVFVMWEKNRNKQKTAEFGPFL